MLRTEAKARIFSVDRLKSENPYRHQDLDRSQDYRLHLIPCPLVCIALATKLPFTEALRCYMRLGFLCPPAREPIMKYSEIVFAFRTYVDIHALRYDMIYDIIYAAQWFMSDSILLSGSVLLSERRAAKEYLDCLIRVCYDFASWLRGWRFHQKQMIPSNQCCINLRIVTSVTQK